MTACASRSRASGRVPRHSIPYCASIAMLPMPKATSARPSDSSSSVAADWAMRVGSRRKTPETHGPSRMRVVLVAAAARIGQMSLWYVSSAP